jgi:hypothetical protein
MAEIYSSEMMIRLCADSDIKNNITNCQRLKKKIVRLLRSAILDLGTGWVSFTPRPIYPRVKRPHDPFDERLGALQSRSGYWGEQENLALPGIEPGSSSPSLYRLHFQSREKQKRHVIKSYMEHIRGAEPNG